MFQVIGGMMVTSPGRHIIRIGSAVDHSEEIAVVCDAGGLVNTTY